MGVILGPSFADLFAKHTQFDTGSVGLFKMSVQSGSRYGLSIQFFKESVDGVRTAKGLFFFQFNGFFDDLTGNVARFATIGSALT